MVIEAMSAFSLTNCGWPFWPQLAFLQLCELHAFIECVIADPAWNLNVNITMISKKCSVESRCE